ncbi:hypothetical protein ACFL0T_04940 [Candidatus Omnitrophota bacterium]
MKKFTYTWKIKEDQYKGEFKCANKDALLVHIKDSGGELVEILYESDLPDKPDESSDKTLSNSRQGSAFISEIPEAKNKDEQAYVRKMRFISLSVWAVAILLFVGLYTGYQAMTPKSKSDLIDSKSAQEYSLYETKEKGNYEYYAGSPQKRRSAVVVQEGVTIKTWLMIFGTAAAPAFLFLIIHGIGGGGLLPDSMESAVIKLCVGVISTAVWLFLYYIFNVSLFLIFIPITIFAFFYTSIFRYVRNFYDRKYGKPRTSANWICRKCGAENHVIDSACEKCNALRLD